MNHYHILLSEHVILMCINFSTVFEVLGIFLNFWSPSIEKGFVKRY